MKNKIGVSVKESLVIQNIGPLKNVVIPEIKPITVFIGESASGKSCLLKITALFRYLFKVATVRAWLKSAGIKKSPFKIHAATYWRKCGLADMISKESYVQFSVEINGNKYTLEYKNGAVYSGLLDENMRKHGQGTLKQDSLTFDGIWRNDTLLYGNGNLKRSAFTTYNLKVEKTGNESRTITISLGGNTIMTKSALSMDMSGDKLVNMLTDMVLLKEREISTTLYKKHLAGKYFFLKIPLDKYLADVFKMPIVGAEFRRMIDKSMVLVIGIAPISENKLLFIQHPQLREAESYDRGYLIQQTGFMKNMSDVGIYNYTLENGNLRFKSVADFAGGNYQINNDGSLRDIDFKISLPAYSLDQFNGLLERSIRKNLTAVQKEAKDHSLSENHFMTNRELQEKYKTSQPDRAPSFPGGKNAMMQFLRSNLQYPSICQANGIQGTVVLQFTVTRDGELKDIKVVREINPYLEKEAIRVIKLMPKWEPAISGGQYVDDVYTMPVSFKLG